MTEPTPEQQHTPVTNEVAFASQQKMLDDLVQATRESRERKTERHGDKFDNRQAVEHAIKRLMGVPYPVLVVMTATALDRLAQMPDFVPSDVADLEALLNLETGDSDGAGSSDLGN